MPEFIPLNVAYYYTHVNSECWAQMNAEGRKGWISLIQTHRIFTHIQCPIHAMIDP